MRLSRIDFVPVLAIIGGGVLGASLSFSFVGSRAVGLPAPDLAVAPSAALQTVRFEVPPVRLDVPTVRYEVVWRPSTDVEGVQARAEDLVREQHYIEEAMDRLAAMRGGSGSEAGRRLFERKEAMHDEVADLEQEILRLSREVQGEESDRLNDAATTIGDDKLKERVRYSRGLIGIQDREYTREFEAETSRIVEALQEELIRVRADRIAIVADGQTVIYRDGTGRNSLVRFTDEEQAAFEKIESIARQLGYVRERVAERLRDGDTSN